MVVTSYLTKLCQFALQKRATFIVKGSCDFLSDKDFPPSHCFLDTYNLQTHKGYNRYLSAFCERLNVLVNLATPSENKPIQRTCSRWKLYLYSTTRGICYLVCLSFVKLSLHIDPFVVTQLKTSNQIENNQIEGKRLVYSFRPNLTFTLHFLG